MPKTNSVFGAWERYISIDGNRIFHVGNACSTCSVFFDRLAQLSPSSYDNITNQKQKVFEALNEGVQTLSSILIDSLKMIMPNGEYDIILSTITPKLVYPGKPGDYFIEERAKFLGNDYKNYSGNSYPKTEYYRIINSVPSILEKYNSIVPVDEIQQPYIDDLLLSSVDFFEFLIPLFSPCFLNKERVNYYTERLLEEKMSTCITLAIPDFFSPQCETSGSKNEHWYLMHYLIDGHHKAYAAASLNKPITCISFVPLNPWTITQ